MGVLTLRVTNRLLNQGVDIAMKQAITGIAPSVAGEVASMTIWPTVGCFSLGQTVGKLSANRIGWGFFTLGKVLALVTIPLSLVVFAWRFLPFAARRYTLTNQRVMVQKGLSKTEEKSIGLDEFDAIEIRVAPGQEFFHAGDVIFTRGGEEVLSLAGVSRPEPFRQVCLKAQAALLSVRAVLEQQAPSA